MSSEHFSLITKKIASMVLNLDDFCDRYDGILLCEGAETSIDVKLYQRVYPFLMVIPVGGWSEVMRLVPRVRHRLGSMTNVLGMIDRDSRSKKEIKSLRQKGIYCTKLPFIENVISSPEIIHILSTENGLDGDENVRLMQENLMHVLSQHLRDSLPINIPIRDDEPLASITIRILKTSEEVVEKTVDESSIMYAYRDKAVVYEASEVLQIFGRKKYYRYFMSCLDDEVLGPKLAKCAASCLPIIELPEKNKYDEY